MTEWDRLQLAAEIATLINLDTDLDEEGMCGYEHDGRVIVTVGKKKFGFTILELISND